MHSNDTSRGILFEISLEVCYDDENNGTLSTKCMQNHLLGGTLQQLTGSSTLTTITDDAVKLLVFSGPNVRSL